MEDEDIIARILETGDRDLFGILVERHRERVLRIAASVLGPSSGAAAEEAAQEAFLKAFRGLAGFRGRARFSTWLFRIAYRQALDARVSQKPSRPALPLDSIREPASALDLFDDLYKQERAAAVSSAVEELPDLYRAAVNMFYWLDMSVEEIAEMLDVPANTIKSYLFRARALLKGRLSGLSASGPGSRI